MQPDLELAYLVVEVPDPAALDTFFRDVVGLVPGEPGDGDSRTWRNDDKAHRILVEAGGRNDATTIGLEVTSDAAFDGVVERLTAAGHDVEHGDAADLARRRVSRLVRTATPWGVTLEIVSGLAEATPPFSSASVPGGFLTEGVGFGHVVFATTAFDESVRFAIDVLGFGRSDWLSMPIGDGIELEVRFLHCNPRHHTLALARAPFDLPQQLHHLMVEVNDRDDVGAAFDRAWATDLPIPNGLGRHDNDGMFSFYVQSPAGFQVEVGYGGVEVEQPWTNDRAYDRISAWGHQPLR
ncbi:MAG: VOC family protein [Ilumatobacter sp.]|nr:VOC family protein [Ilumatobacter sp.]